MVVKVKEQGFVVSCDRKGCKEEYEGKVGEKLPEGWQKPSSDSPEKVRGKWFCSEECLRKELATGDKVGRKKGSKKADKVADSVDKDDKDTADKEDNDE